MSPSWLDGTAIVRVLESPLARPGFLRDAALGLPAPLLRSMSYAALALELFVADPTWLPKRLTRLAAPRGRYGIALPTSTR